MSDLLVVATSTSCDDCTISSHVHHHTRLIMLMILSKFVFIYITCVFDQDDISWHGGEGFNAEVMQVSQHTCRVSSDQNVNCFWLVIS